MKPGRHLCDAARDSPVTSLATSDLKPAVLLGVNDRLDSVASAGLCDGRGEVVPHRPFGKIKLPRNVRDGGPAPGGGEHVLFPSSERIGAACKRLRGEHRVDDPL